MIRSVPWILLALALVACGWLLARSRGQLRAEADARAAAEAESLRLAGQVVVQPRDPDHLEDRIKRLEHDNAELAAALERTRRAAPGARPVAVASASTGPVVAEAPPTHATDPAPCLLSPGDRAEVRVDQVVLETRAGNRLLVGVASAWRVDPAPASRLFGGPFSSPLTGAEAVPVVRADGWPRWLVGLAAGGALVVGGLAGYGAARLR